MTGSVGTTQPDDSLRERAEALIREGSATRVPAVPMDSVPSMLHELQVHQIELEMQNDELRRTQLELHESRARYFDLYEFAPVGYLTLTETGVISEVNFRAAVMLGVTREELIGAPLHRFILPADQDLYYHHRRGLRANGARQVVELRLRDCGGALCLRVASVLSEDATGKISCRTTLDDISEVKRMQAEAEQQTAELLVAKERAEAATCAKERFLSSVSHEMRTPLNGIIGMTDLLLASDQTPAQQGYASTVRNSSDALLAIINDILDFSKMAAGKLTLAPAIFDLASLAQGVIDLMGAAAREKGLSLRMRYAAQTPRNLLGDAGRIRQILLNLVSNAIKFTERGEVSIEIGNAPASSFAAGCAEIRIEVHDTGIGIPAARQNLLFERFEQLAESPASRSGGTGLGLAIVKELVQLMHGTVSVSSEAGHGSCFTVSLPLALAQPARDTDPAAPAGPTLTAAGGFRPGRVLLVEDHPVNQRVAVALLTKLGCTVDVAANGLAGYQLATERTYDLILMDCHMPVMDGFAATVEIRRHEEKASRHTPVVGFTASVSSKDHQDCMDHGMDDFIAKPVSLRALATMLARWLPKHHDRPI